MMPAITIAAKPRIKGYNTVTAGISNRKYDDAKMPSTTISRMMTPNRDLR